MEALPDSKRGEEMKKLLPALFVAFFVGLIFWPHAGQSPTVMAEPKAEQKPIQGYEAPHFTLIGMDNQTYQLNGKRNKPLILNFWASWCGPCQMEAPELRKFYQKFGQQVDLYAINVTSEDSVDGAKNFVQTYKLLFPVPMDKTGEVANRYRIMAFPTTFLIDQQGIIRKTIIGMVDAAVLEQEVRKLLSEKR
jgi:cytochrome c biogenesis protein CcmG, thiol:disulfide interchange protein DsbE